MASYFDTRPTIEEFDYTIANDNIGSNGTVVYNIPSNRVAFVKVRAIQTQGTGSATRRVRVIFGSNLSSASGSGTVTITNGLKVFPGIGTSGFLATSGGFTTVYDADQQSNSFLRTSSDTANAGGWGYDGELIEYRNLSEVRVYSITGSSGSEQINYQVRLFLRVYLFGT